MQRPRPIQFALFNHPRGATGWRRCPALASLVVALAAASAAHAASSITLYGIADAGWGYSLYTHGTGTNHLSHRSAAMRDGGLDDSRWGLRGSEELGGGLRATFQIEQGLHLSDGAAASGTGAFNRIATVGVASNAWGDFTAGLQRGVSEKFFKVNTYEGLGKMERAFGAYKIRRNGLFRYLSPSAGGLQLGLGYAPEGTAPSPGLGRRTNYFTSGLGYTRGPLHLAATFDQEQPLGADGERLGYTVKNWALGGSYDFKVIRFNLVYGQDRNGKMNAPGAVNSATLGSPIAGLGAYNNRGFRSKNYFLSAMAPLGPGQLGLTWSRSTANLTSVYAAGHAGAALKTSAQNIFSAVYRWPLSKRTTLYAYGAYANGLAYLSGFRGREAGLGLLHRF